MKILRQSISILVCMVMIMLIIGCGKPEISQLSTQASGSSLENQLLNSSDNIEQKLKNNASTISYNTLPKLINPNLNNNVLIDAAHFFSSDFAMVLVTIHMDAFDLKYVCSSHDGGKSWGKPQMYDPYTNPFSKGIYQDIYWDFSMSDEKKISLGEDTWSSDYTGKNWVKLSSADTGSDVYRPIGSHDGITIEDIKRKYSPEDIKSITQYQDNYLLIGSGVAPNTPGEIYTLYDLRTGYMDLLDIRPSVTKLEAVNNPNSITFYANGQIQFDPFSGFPFYISFTRENEGQEFTKQDIAKFFNLNKGTTFGNTQGALISDVNTAGDGLEIKFEPVAEIPGSFVIADGWIPVTDVSYLEEKDRIILQFAKTIISDKYKHSGMIIDKQNEYLSSIQLEEDKDYGRIIVNLKPSAKKYAAKTDNKLIIEFSGE